MLMKNGAAVLQVGSAASQWAHDEATRLGRQYDRGLARKADSYCMGLRRFGKPMMALHVQQKLGPVRHALSQMVVAGTMTTQPPIRVRVWSPFADAEVSLEPSAPAPVEAAVEPEAPAEDPAFAGALAAADEGPKNQVFELALGKPKDNRIYEVDAESDDVK